MGSSQASWRPAASPGSFWMRLSGCFSGCDSTAGETRPQLGPLASFPVCPPALPLPDNWWEAKYSKSLDEAPPCIFEDPEQTPLVQEDHSDPMTLSFPCLRSILCVPLSQPSHSLALLYAHMFLSPKFQLLNFCRRGHFVSPPLGPAKHFFMCYLRYNLLNVLNHIDCLLNFSFALNSNNSKTVGVMLVISFCEIQ